MPILALSLARWAGAVWMALCLAGVLAGSAHAHTSPHPPPPDPGTPVPLAPGQECTPDSVLPACHVPPAGQPAPGPLGPPPGDTGQDPPGLGAGWTWLTDLLSGWVEGFLEGVAKKSLSPLLDFLGRSMLSTPELAEYAGMQELWNNSRYIVLITYGIVVLIAGIVVMAHQTIQAQHSIRDVLPRVVVGFLAANLSLLVGGQAIHIANALALSLLGNAVSPDDVGKGLTQAIGDDLDGAPVFIVLITLALLVMIVLVLLTYVVRVMLTVLLLAAVPLFLMCHALPQTEQIAFWWWKAFGGVLVIQLGQSLAFAAAVKLFFSPRGIVLF